jgi:DUF1680 family protein
VVAVLQPPQTLRGTARRDALCGGNTDALAIAAGFAGYIERTIASLDDAQMQTLLDCEHGGINESFAELSARTHEPRWLALAERFYHRRVLDPLSTRRDELEDLHANTQIPKLIGLARLHELTLKPEYGTAARFFWDTVTANHSYVIGGNSDRERFFARRTSASHLTEQTCEGCNTYNMLKLTRQVYAWQPDGALFDYYERAHLNHILGQQEAATGRFTYMTPLLAGAPREWSEPTSSFWCCVGTGMESHSKHGDSIWWEGPNALFVNLFIPSRAMWREHGAELELTTAYPYRGTIDVKVATLAQPARFSLALRIPAWATTAVTRVNGRIVTARRASGYAWIQRRWRAGDVVSLELPLALRLESAPANNSTSAAVVTVMRGPLVLAADLGAADAPFDAVAPALVGSDVLAGFAPLDPDRATYRTTSVGRPTQLTFAPFYSSSRRRSAVYLARFNDADWAHEERAFAAEQTRRRALDARSLDVIALGNAQSEKDHGLTSDISYALAYRGRPGRDARTGGFFAFRARTHAGALTLQASYWGDERNRTFHILIDGTRLATQALHPGTLAFFDVDYAIPLALTSGKATIEVRFEPAPGNTVGPVFGCRILRA